MSHNNVEQLKREFLEYLEIERGRSLKTIVNYDRYLSRFIEFSKIKNPKDISENTLRSYRLWLNRQSAGIGDGGEQKTLKKNTQNYYLIALRAFLKYLQRRGVDAHPMWSPDGKRIAFTSNRDGNPEIYLMNADGSRPRRITNHPERDDHPGWHPDSKRIVFIGERDGDHDLYLIEVLK